MHSPVKSSQTVTDRVVIVAQSGRSLQDILNCPTPISKLPTLRPKNTSRVLTSEEYLKIVAEKQKIKEEEAKRKEEQKQARLMKKEEAERKKKKQANQGGCLYV